MLIHLFSSMVAAVVKTVFTFSTSTPLIVTVPSLAVTAALAVKPVTGALM